MKLQKFTRVFDFLVEQHENSRPDSAELPFDIREVDYDEYYNVSVRQIYNLPLLRSKSSKVFELPPVHRSAATKISSSSTVASTMIDAPKSLPRSLR